MKKIKSFSLVSFTNHALVSFCTEVESHVKASLPVENAALCDVFGASLKCALYGQGKMYQKPYILSQPFKE